MTLDSSTVWVTPQYFFARSRCLHARLNQNATFLLKNYGIHPIYFLTIHEKLSDSHGVSNFSAVEFHETIKFEIRISGS